MVAEATGAVATEAEEQVAAEQVAEGKGEAAAD